VRYTDNVSFAPNTVGHTALRVEVPPLWVPTPSPNNPIWRRMHQVFDVEHFLYLRRR
jgi:hypothetical protein